MMRIEIESTDRVGISQEILRAFAEQDWDLKKVEIISGYIYIHVEYAQLVLTKIQACLVGVQGFLNVREITLLPSEQRENHLQALLDKIPEPIIDLDKDGLVLALNQAAKKLITINENSAIGMPVKKVLKLSANLKVKQALSSHTLSVDGKTYVADLTPVYSSVINNEQSKSSSLITGAVLVLRSMNTLGRQISLMQSHLDNGFDTIIGQSSKINLIKEQSKRYAELELPVLITGETGTGKELIARALHQASNRAKQAFLAINCAALPEHLLESELFGYDSGAFTGAKKGGKPGLIELAEGGSLFLDEIAEMSPYLQAKLLRFLQDYTYRRVGGTKELTANIRIISASHQQLEKLIEQKDFREDLFYRLNVLNLDLPPLRERNDDIELLANFFIDNAMKQVNPVDPEDQQNAIQPTLTKNALTLLQAYEWPGNIRQLQNVLFSTVALNKSRYIEECDLKQILSKFTVKEDNKESVSSEQTITDWSSAQAEFESTLLNKLSPLYPSTRKLAERLKVSHNKIAMKLREHQIKPSE
jgi:TyrR family helix-turn-helix protein